MRLFFRLRRLHQVHPYLLTVLLGATGGCSSVSESPRDLAPSARLEILRRAGEELQAVDLFKPSYSDSAATEFRLSPLFLIQSDAIQTPTFPLSQVHFYRATNSVLGRRHEQWTYLWRNSDRAGRRDGVQAIRITLNAAGEPSIWEVLDDRSGAELIWVSQAFEIAAAAEFGPPLPGRFCSSEAAFEKARRLVVPGIVDDGPAPMGPVLYGTPDGDIRNVACRCSAPQAEALEAQGMYELTPITATGAHDWIEKAAGPHFAESWFAPDRLQQRLRVPGTF